MDELYLRWYGLAAADFWKHELALGRTSHLEVCIANASVWRSKPGAYADAVIDAFGGRPEVSR